MTEQIKSAERDCNNCIFRYDFSLAGCRLWECKGTVTIEDVEKGIRSLQSWEEVLQELEKKDSLYLSYLDNKENPYDSELFGKHIAVSNCIDIINQHLAEIEE